MADAISSNASATRDCFICHASEDKEAIARPLAEALKERGYEVWFDEYELGVGDSLREAIDKGLATSRFGIVVLSEQFFEKKWTQHELNGLIAREIVGGERLLLPIWHEINETFLIKVSPPLADRVAVRSAEGLETVVDRISRALDRRRYTGATDGASEASTATQSAEAPLPGKSAPIDLVESGNRVRLGYTDAELRRYAEGGGDPRGPGWLSVIVGPTTLQEDLLDPTVVQVSDLRALVHGVPGRWIRDRGLLDHYDFKPKLDGFHAQLPLEKDALPAYSVKLSEDGLMEFGTTLERALSSGISAHDRVIPTHRVAKYIHDYALLFLRILEHVGYEGEAVALAVFSGVEGHRLGVEERRHLNRYPLEAEQVASRPLRGLVRELPNEVGRWVKKTMDRLFLAGGITTGAYFIDSDGELTD